MKVLVDNYKHIVRLEDICKAVYSDSPAFYCEGTVRVNIYRLHKKIKEHLSIVNRRGIGFMLTRNPNALMDDKDEDYKLL